MDPVSNIDGLVLLLRQRLQERQSAAQASKGERRRSGDRAPVGREAVRALAAIHGVDDRPVARALLQSILADQFGEELINEPEFQQVVDRVADTMTQDPSAARLLARMVTELRNQAR